MSTAIISKEQAKFARYLANKAFEKKGTAKKADGKKERTYITVGCALIWTEVPVTEGIEVEVLKAVWHDKEYSGGMLVYDSRHMDFMSALSILGCESETEDAEPHQDAADAVAMAVECPAQGPTDVPTTDGSLAASAQPGEDATAPIAETHPEPVPDLKPALSLREKLDKCAEMRLARLFGYTPGATFKEIVEGEGTSAVLKYQEILQAVPTYGLTEARLKAAFPAEYVWLP